MEAENNQAMEANNSITLSMVLSDNSANTAASANGPMAQVVPILPDLNLEAVPNGPVSDQAQHLQPAAHEENLLFPITQAQPGPDLSLEAIIQQEGPTQGDRMEDPMYFELMAHAVATSCKKTTTHPRGATNLVKHADAAIIRNQEEPLPDTNLNVSIEQQNTTDIIVETGDNSVDPTNLANAVVDHGQEDVMVQLLAGTEQLQSEEPEAEQILKDITGGNMTKEENLIGIEGAKVWKKHFAPTEDSKDIIQGTQMHENSPSSDKATTEVMSASSTSALHKNKKRKENVPMVETEVSDKDTTEELLSKRTKKNKSSSTAMEGNKSTKEQNMKWI